MTNIDLAIFRFINEKLACSPLDFLFTTFTSQTIISVLAIFLIILSLWKGEKKLRVAVISAVIAIVIIDPLVSQVIKPLVARIRPCHIYTVRLLVDCGGKWSFFSNHSANSAGFCSAFGFFCKKTQRISLAVISFLIGVSRIYVGVHYPSDVLAGWIFGTIVGITSAYITRKIFIGRLRTRSASVINEFFAPWH